MRTGTETAISRKEGFALVGSPRIFQRMQAAKWLEIARCGGPGKATLFTRESVEAAMLRIEAGEHPPLLPSETKSQEKADL